MMLLGIAGLARSGKDTLADHLLSNHGFAKASFAEPIKHAVQAMFGLDARHTDGDLKEVPLPDLGVSPRQLMQTLGTDWGREMVAHDVWLIAAKRRTRQVDAGRLVFSDLRFENEAQWVRDQGGLVIHIRRSGAVAVRSHVSEAGVSLAPGDFEFNNEGSLQALFARADALVASFEGSANG